MASTKRLKIIFSSISSAAKIADNDDLLLKILSRLPVKSLLKFKSVSKHWLSLISNPKFSRLGYSPQSPCICGLFLLTSTRITGDYQFDFINLRCKHSTALSVSYPPQVMILDSCNGLLLCRDVDCNREASIYRVCNPTTKQYAVLPPLNPISDFCVSCLAFDPLKSADYKVVCVHRRAIEIKQFNYQIEIYSSRSGFWRPSEAGFSLDFSDGIHGWVFWNGGIHWLTSYGRCFYFNLDEEQIKELPMPNPNRNPDDWFPRRVEHFDESGGRLHLIKICDQMSSQFDEWELQRDYSGWLLKYRVDLDEVAEKFPGMVREFRDSSDLDYYAFEIYCVVEGEKDEDSGMVMHVPDNIIWYDFKTRNVSKICDFPPSRSSSLDRWWVEKAGTFRYSSVHNYIESFVNV